MKKTAELVELKRKLEENQGVYEETREELANLLSRYGLNYNDIGFTRPLYSKTCKYNDLKHMYFTDRYCPEDSIIFGQSSHPLEFSSCLICDFVYVLSFAK